MKKLLVAFGIMLFSASAFAQETEVKWYTFEEAIKLNKQEKRKIFIDVYTDWCGWCKKMEQNTFTHPVIARILNEEYYAVRFDAESTAPITFQGKEFLNEGDRSRSPHQLAIALLQGKMSYPSIAYMDENNQLLTAVPGYYDPKGLEPILKFFAEGAYKNTNFQDYKASFESEIQ
jgi:thioredoxin-related protein